MMSCKVCRNCQLQRGHDFLDSYQPLSAQFIFLPVCCLALAVTIQSELEGAVPFYGIQHHVHTENMLYWPSEINSYLLENIDVEGGSSVCIALSASVVNDS